MKKKVKAEIAFIKHKLDELYKEGDAKKFVAYWNANYHKINPLKGFERLYKGGMGMRELAAHFSISYVDLYKYKNANNIKTLYRARKKNKVK